jgi:SAM-dependent methyltransferase
LSVKLSTWDFGPGESIRQNGETGGLDMAAHELDLLAYNRQAWDKAVERGSEWTVPVGPEIIAAARQGDWQIRLTPTKPVPRTWFPVGLHGVKVLGLAAGGGQQGPVLAAAGAQMTILDNSPSQLAQDRLVAEREGLDLRTVQGDMANLHMFENGAFDLIVHPCSNMFTPDVCVVWREAYRVLRPGGALLAGFWNPAYYIFDLALADEGKLRVRHKLPYSDLSSLTAEERRRYLDDLQPLEFSHTLDDQIGGQLDAGFLLAGFYEDGWEGVPLSDYMPIFIATRAIKPG